MNDKEKILKKIKKCLALSKSTNPHEAAVALKQAQALMAEHSISDVDVEISDVFEFATNWHPSEKRTDWDWALARVVGNAFGCDYLNNQYHCQSKMIFIGVNAAPELAAYTYNVLKRQLLKARAHYLKTTLKRIVRKNRTARADKFCMGWVYEVRQQVKEFANPQQNKSAIEKYIAKNHTDLFKAGSINRQPSHTSGYSDQTAGALAADGVQLFRPVNGQNNALLEQR